MAAIEQGIAYYFYNPSQSAYFALNAPADAKFCGYVSDVTGLDDAGVRENAQVVVAGDGGYHGPFWADRRPWTMAGDIMPQFPLLARDQSQELMQGILAQCLKSDGFLKWTPADGNARMLKFRKQQPTRNPKGQSVVNRQFQIACVTADWRVFSWTQHNVSATGLSITTPTATNIGNAPSPPKFVITGPFTTAGTLRLVNNQTGKAIKFLAGQVNIPSASSWTVDLTGTYPSVTDQSGNTQYGLVDPLNTDWTIAVESSLVVTGGNNTFSATGAGMSAASGLAVYWNDAWA